MFDIVKKDLETLEEEMLSVIYSPVEIITEIGTHLVEAGGKRLRPALYFLAVRCEEINEKNAMPLAVAIEMIHMATLVHDDVIDSAATRRGISTANAKWGNQLSILSGDYLFAKAFSLVAKNDYDDRVMVILSDIICDLSEGEIIQNKEIYKASEDKDEYYDRIAKKTANFIAASCQLGGIVAGMCEDEIESLRKYGYAIGMAFQITDDILDLTATSEQIGKPAGNDIMQGIVTLPVIHALNVSSDAEELKRIVTTRTIDQQMLKRGLEIVHATDAIEYSYEKVNEYLDYARSVLPDSIPAEIRETYETVADFIAMRQF
ncbi:polyprenyl synthetase family protein [Massilibacillus massiliensis]